MLRNFTPYEVIVVDGHIAISYESEGIARVSAKSVQVGTVDDIPLIRQEFGEVEGLPAPKEGTYLIVSRMVASALPERRDLVVPADLVRNGKGEVIGCKAFESN